MVSQVSYPLARGVLLLRIAGCFGFVGAAVWASMVSFNDSPSGILTSVTLIGCGGYFVYVGAAYITALFDGAGLRADEAGFSYRFLWQRRRFSWREVSEFKVADYRMLSVVAFNRPSAPDDWRTRTNQREIGASDFIIAHNFKASPLDVCRTLNELRNRALGVA